MGRITTRTRVTKVDVTTGALASIDSLAVEEPLEIRVAGKAVAITMRTPGNDVELAAGFLLSEGVIRDAAQFRSAIHCAGTPGEPNSYNVLDITLTPDAMMRVARADRNFYISSSCGMCGKTSIDAVETNSSFGIADDSVTISADALIDYPRRLRERQAAFDKTGGLHAAALFDAVTGDLLVAREDVGRHNAVDKVTGWALLNEHIPLHTKALQVSGRASFELVQKAVMAGIPILAAVSAPSSLAVELAERAGLTLVGFVRGDTMNVYTRNERVRVPSRVSVR